MNKKGFTMTEVIIATLIVAIISAGMFSAFWGSQHFLNCARHRMQAYNFAMEAIDRLRSNYKYNDSPQMDADLPDAWKTELNGLKDIGMLNATLAAYMGVDAANFDLKYRVEAESQPNSYKQVEVKVIWYEPTFKE